MNRAWRRVATAALMASLFGTCAVAAPSVDEVRRIVAGFAGAWNHHDMDAFGKLFTTDAEFVNVTGTPMKGRQAIQMHHAWSHGVIPENTSVPGTLPANYGIFKNSTMKFNTIDVRFLRPDIALAHVDWELVHDARTSVPRRGVFLFVLSLGKDGWQIAAAQNTEINRPVK